MQTITFNTFLRRFLLVGGFALISLGSSLYAQRIASIDLQKILSAMPEYQEAQAEIDKYANQERQRIAQQYDEIKSLYNRYQAEQVLLSDQERKNKEEEIMAKEQEVREMQKDIFGPDGALFQKRQDLVSPIQEKVYQAIDDYAQEKGYDFIFDRGGAAGIIYSNDRYDKTQDVLDALGIK